jgi:poly-gamma-glutamate synthesis protein (capsule biosynthesis protein)
MEDRDGMMLAFLGNTYVEHPVSAYRDEGFLRAIDLLKSADVSLANLEGAIIDGDEWPAFGSGMGWAGTYLGAPPLMVDELKFMGINGLYAANNHVADFGENGILSTIKHLRRGGIPFAGIGASLTEASQPCYISTGHGRVAVISAADWGPRQKMDLPTHWPFGYMPSDDGPYFTSRPGVNLLRYDAALTVDREAFDEVKRISRAFEWDRAKAARREGGGQHSQPLIGPTMVGWERDTDTEFWFMGRKFVLGDRFDFSTFPYQEDLDRLFKHVRDARRQADVVVVALHDQIHGEEIHDYVRAAAYGCIDAGADIFVCTGGGYEKGIELYEGGVILHSCSSSLSFQNSQVSRIPPSVLKRMGYGPDATAADFVAFRAGSHGRSESAGGLGAHLPGDPGTLLQAVVFDRNCNLKEVRGYPIEKAGGTRHGIGRLAEPGSEVFDRVLQRTEDRCKNLNTEFAPAGSYGVLKAE